MLDFFIFSVIFVLPQSVVLMTMPNCLKILLECINSKKKF